MRRSSLAVFAAATLMLSQPLAPVYAAGCPLGGIAGNVGVLGSSSNPFAIASAADLASLMACSGVANHFEITQDLDLGGDANDPATAWAPLGTWTTPFHGVIDGAGHTIRNLFIAGNTQNLGLFGSIGTSQIKDLTLVGEAVSEADYVGLLAGSVVGTAVFNNVDVAGSVSGIEEVGLLMGAFYPDLTSPPHTLLITGSDVSGQTRAREVAGGLIGAFYGNNDTESLEINNSRVQLEHRYFVPNQGTGAPYAIGGLIGLTIGVDEVVISTSDVVVDIDITSALHSGGDAIGGVVGDGRGQDLAIHSVRVFGEIADNNFDTTAVGGLLGDSAYSNNKSIQQSVFSGRVAGEWGVGGLVGQELGQLNGTSVIGESEAHGEVVARVDSGGLVGYAQILGGGSLMLTDLANFATVTSDALPGDPDYNVSTHAGGFGGLVGVIKAENATASPADIVSLRRSANYGPVVSPGEYAGGIAGEIYSWPGDVALQDVANYGAVTGVLRTGGITGRAHLYQTVVNADMKFERVFSSAPSVEASNAGVLGGIVAEVRIGTAPDDLEISQNSTFSTVFWDSQASGVGNDAATGTAFKSTAELSSSSTYSDAGFDISSGWSLNNSPSTLWGICPGFNGGVAFLNAHFTSDPCAVGFSVTAPTLGSISGSWSSAEWNACGSFQAGAPYLIAQYETDPCFQAQTVPGGYSGPVVLALSERTVTTCGETELSITGLHLAGAAVLIQGVAAETLSAFDGELRVLVPAGLTAELGADIVLVSAFGTLRVQDALDVLADCDPGLTVWTKQTSAAEVKVYARGVVGVGKVQFFVNGREVAWVRAADGSDPKLRTPSAGPMAGVSYLVRTVPLVAGKNAFEVHVDGQRVLRRVATG